MALVTMPTVCSASLAAINLRQDSSSVNANTIMCDKRVGGIPSVLPRSRAVRLCRHASAVILKSIEMTMTISHHPFNESTSIAAPTFISSKAYIGVDIPGVEEEL